jgi:hypothetical protein
MHFGAVIPAFLSKICTYKKAQERIVLGCLLAFELWVVLYSEGDELHDPLGWCPLAALSVLERPERDAAEGLPELGLAEPCALS